MTIEEVDNEDSSPITPPQSCHVMFNISHKNPFVQDNNSSPSGTSTETGPPPEEHEDFTYVFHTPTLTQPQNNIPSTPTPGSSHHTDPSTPTPAHRTQPTHTPSQCNHGCGDHTPRSGPHSTQRPACTFGPAGNVDNDHKAKDVWQFFSTENGRHLCYFCQ